MSDLYVEQLVKRTTPMGLVVAKGCMIAVTILLYLGAFVKGIGQLSLILAVAMSVVDYFVFMQWDIEYEYLFVENELTFDKIMGKAKRKKLRSIEMDKIEAIAKKGSYHLDSFKKIKCELADYTAHEPSHEIYEIYVRLEKGMLKICFEPNEKMVQALKNAAPRKVFSD